MDKTEILKRLRQRPFAKGFSERDSFQCNHIHPTNSNLHCKIQCSRFRRDGLALAPLAIGPSLGHLPSRANASGGVCGLSLAAELPYIPLNCGRGGECAELFGTANGFSAASGGPCGPCDDRSRIDGDLACDPACGGGARIAGGT